MKRKHKRVNPLVRHPLLRKGGAHGKPYKAERRAARQRLGRLSREDCG